MLGLKNRTLLSAAYDRFGGEIDASYQPPEEKQDGSVPSLLGISFHSDGAVGEDTEPENLYVEIGEEVEKHVKNSMEELVQKSIANGLSEWYTNAAKNAKQASHNLSTKTWEGTACQSDPNANKRSSELYANQGQSTLLFFSKI